MLLTPREKNTCLFYENIKNRYYRMESSEEAENINFEIESRVMQR